MAATSSVSRANEDYDGILHNVKWASTSISYSFPTSASFYGAGYGLENETDAGFEVMNATQIAAIENIFAELESFTNLDFTEITETAVTHATMRFAMTDNTPTAHAYTPNSFFAEGGDAWFANGGTYDNPNIGNFSYVTFAHEIGHALGLRHGHEADGYGALATAQDSEEFSIMTYRDYIGDSLDGSENETWGNPQSFMMLDIAALQYMYGADYSAAGNVWSGDTVYTFSSTTGEMFINGVGQGTPGGNRIFKTVWDGHGTDTYDFSNYSNGIYINLGAGEWTQLFTQRADLNDFASGFEARGNVANALMVNGDTRSLIENAIGGSGRDRLEGNEVANVLTGGGGDDTFYATAGGDTYNGGTGTDTVQYQNVSGDLTIDLANGQTTGARTDTLTSIEVAFGSNGNDTLIGTSAANRLFGGGGNDRFVGTAGNDYLSGGSGGVDTLDYSALSFDFSLNLTSNSVIASSGITIFTDSLSSIENASTGDGYDTITGSSVANVLNAGDGNDTLRGSLGGDTLNGSTGIDTVDYSQTAINRSVTIDLAAGTTTGDYNDTLISIENATGGWVNDTIFGTNTSNTLNGYIGDDLLYGRGGNDILNGSTGTDLVGYNTLAGALTIDLINGRTTGATTDTLISIESAVGGSGNDTLIGNDVNNVLFGHHGNDTIVGSLGTDYLHGNGGIDTVDYSSLSVNLNINLQLNATSGAFADTLLGFENVIGTSGNNSIIGTSDANSLSGGGGNDSFLGDRGNDTIDGGTGFDVAHYSDRAALNIHTKFVGGQFVTTVTDTGPSNGDDGIDTLTNIEGISINPAEFFLGLTGIQQNNDSNVDGDAYNELLFRNVNTNSTFFVDIDGTGALGNVHFANQVPGWTAVGAMDMFTVGQSQVVYRNDATGTLVGYGANDSGTGWNHYLGGLTSDWTFEGIGDFTGDGFNDLLIMGPSGQLYFYDRDSAGVNTGWRYITATSNIWDPVDVGDFDRDGISDVLVQDRTTGTTYYMNMDAGGFAGWGLVATGLGANMRAEGVADVDGDGYDDIIYRNQLTGEITGINMAGGVNSGTFTAGPNLGLGWEIAGFVDYDNDGWEDIVIRNTANGQHAGIDMNNGGTGDIGFTGFDSLSQPLGDDWMLI